MQYILFAACVVLAALILWIERRSAYNRGFSDGVSKGARDVGAIFAEQYEREVALVAAEMEKENERQD